MPFIRCPSGRAIVTLQSQNGISKIQPEYTPPAPFGLPPEVRPVAIERSRPLSKKRKLTEDQERQRMDGLRILARIIARHYLAHPELYPQPVDGTAPAAKNDEVHEEDAA